MEEQNQKSHKMVEISTPVLSKWRCFLFGSEPMNGIVWRPTKGNVPCMFHRIMQRILIGNRWVKDKD